MEMVSVINSPKRVVKLATASRIAVAAGAQVKLLDKIHVGDFPYLMIHHKCHSGKVHDYSVIVNWTPESFMIPDITIQRETMLRGGTGWFEAQSDTVCVYIKNNSANDESYYVELWGVR